MFEKARDLLKDKVLKTPLIPYWKAPHLYLKAESLQPSGSFKIRGATYCISQLSDEERKNGVVAYSTGNHAQAVALAAKKEAIKATIVMSPDVLEFKINATKALGAEVILVNAKDRRSFAENFAKENHAYLIPPFDHPDIIAGQGTIGLEILEEITPYAIFVPVGGGGLISGIAMAIKQKNPHVKIIGVEPELEDDATRSFKEKKLIEQSSPSNTIADAVKIPSLGHITFPLILKYVDEMITVSEEEIKQSTHSILTTTHLLAEPSGALALAGALKYPLPENQPSVCILSGGNKRMKDEG